VPKNSLARSAPSDNHLAAMKARGPVAAILCSTALLLQATAAPAQVHLSLFHPVSTNSDPGASATFAVSVFQSRIGRLEGLGIHPIVSSVEGPASFLLVTGAYSRVAGPFRGFGITGGIAAARDEVRGFQVAGIGNFVEGRTRGFQAAGVVNAVRGDLRGIQFAGFANMNAGQTRGLQVSTVANVSEGPVRGVQLAGGLNFAQDGMNGLQLALGNLTAGASHGAQVGFYNIAGESHALQIGAVNVARRSEGVPIGLVNLSSESGMVEVTGFASTLSAANVGVRTTVNRFQSTLAVGGPDLEGDVSTAGFLTWAFGYRFPIGERFEVGADIGFAHIMPEKTDDPTDHDRLHFALLARLLPEFRISESVGIFAGPGAAVIYDRYGSGAESTSELLATGGLAVRLQ
jgi:hypothetical protein